MVTIELSICLTIDNPLFFCDCYGFINSLPAIAVQLLKCSWDWHEEVGMAIFLVVNSRQILTSWIQVMLGMKDNYESTWFLIFSLLSFLNLFSRGAALFYMFFKQQYAVNSRVRFQFVILKITTLLLNSRVSTTAKLPISLHTDRTQYLLWVF